MLLRTSSSLDIFLFTEMILRRCGPTLQQLIWLPFLLLLLLLPAYTRASTGDRLPEFRECLSVSIDD